ncbi:unnamed protein product [Closterium sp. Yama58-4]|nr:unnamed protein product [Closterium sp. Yama58-4]
MAPTPPSLRLLSTVQSLGLGRSTSPRRFSSLRQSLLLHPSTLALASLSFFLLLPFTVVSTSPDEFPPPHPDDVAALIALKATWGGFQGSDTWRVTRSCREWKGVTCDPANGRVRRIDLSGCQIQGRLHRDIGNLPAMESLILSNNEIDGFLPVTLSRLSKLQSLFLDRNKLSGRIPVGLGSLPNLRMIDFGFNNLTGAIPDDIGYSRSITSLILQHNQIGGKIPSSLGASPSLSVLILNNNRIDGQIPYAIGTAPNLYSLDLSHNRLYGRIPDVFSRSPSLYMFNVANNFLTGQLPDFPAKNGDINGESEFFVDVSSNYLYGPLKMMMGNVSICPTSDRVPGLRVSVGGNCMSGSFSCPLHFLQPQRKPANCNAFCKTFSFAGQCGGQGTCIPKSSISQRLMRNVTCACNEGYLPDPKDPFVCREEGELSEQKEDVLRKEALWRAEAEVESGGGEAEGWRGAEVEEREETVQGEEYQGEGEEGEGGEGQWVSVGDLTEQEAETSAAEGGDEVSVGEWGEVRVGGRAGKGRGTGGAGGAGAAAEGRVDRMLRGSWGLGRALGEGGRRWGEGGQAGNEGTAGIWRKRYSNTRYDRYDAFP